MILNTCSRYLAVKKKVFYKMEVKQFISSLETDVCIFEDGRE